MKRKEDNPCNPRAKGKAEREHWEAAGDVAALTAVAKDVAVEAMKLGRTLGEAKLIEPPPEQRTRITVITMDVYGSSPVAALIPVLEALCAR